MGPYSPPSFPVALPQAECLRPRETDPSWTKCYILTGSSLAALWIQGWGPTGQWSERGERHSHLCRERGRVNLGACTGPEHLQLCISGSARHSLPFPQGSKSSLDPRGLPAHCPVSPGGFTGW